MKIAINTCFGGFRLSEKATDELNKRKGLSKTYYSSYDLDLRKDSDLISIIEELGSEANGSCARIKIVEIPDDVDWTIEEYDGIESVHERHRVWG